MRLLSKRQLRARLVVFAVLASAFTVGVWITELTIETFESVTPWTAFAVVLGATSFASLFRWRSDSTADSQSEWQPALMLRVLGAGLGFQAGVIGYFVANDVVAASVGCAGFLFTLAFAIRAVGRLEYEPAT